jgi:hypothetical protein
MDNTEIRLEIIKLQNKNKALEDEILVLKNKIQETENDMRKEGKGSEVWKIYNENIRSNQASIGILQKQIFELCMRF